MDCIWNCSVPNEQQANQTFSLEISQTALQLYNFYLYLMIVVGISGNFVVLVVFSKLPPNTTTDWFIFFLTAYDFITSFVNVPIYVTFTNGIWKYFGNTIICIIHMFIGQSLVLSSAFLICGLALDRYFKICKPMTPYSQMKARKACLVICLLTTLFSLPTLFMYENRQGLCQAVGMGYILFLYYLFVFLTFILAVAVVVFSYTRVTMRVRASKQTVNMHNRLINTTSSITSIGDGKLEQVVPYSGNMPGPDEMFSGSDTESTVSDVQSPKRVFWNKLQVSNFFRRDASKKAMSETPAHSTSSKNPTRQTLSNEREVLSVQNTVTAKRCSFINRIASTMNTIQRQVAPTGNHATTRTTKIAFLVCTIFIVTWIPPWTSFILSAAGMKQNAIVVNFMLFGRMTHLINTVTNPILYTWLNRKFRRNIMRIFLCRKS